MVTRSSPADGGPVDSQSSGKSWLFPSTLQEFSIFKPKTRANRSNDTAAASQEPLLRCPEPEPPSLDDMDSAIARIKALEVQLKRVQDPTDIPHIEQGYTPAVTTTPSPRQATMSRQARTCPERKRSPWKVPKDTSPYPSMITANTIDAAELPVPTDLDLKSTECLVLSPAGDPVIVPRMCGDVPHPYLSGFKGTDRCHEQSKPGFYAVPWGWNRGIKKDWAVAWANTVGYSQHVGKGWGKTAASTKRFKDPAQAAEYLAEHPLPTGFQSPTHPGITVPHIPGPFNAQAWHNPPFPEDEDDSTFHDTLGDDGETLFGDDLVEVRRTLHPNEPVGQAPTAHPVPSTIQVARADHSQAIAILRQLDKDPTPSNIRLIEQQLGGPKPLEPTLDDGTVSTDAKEQKENNRLRYKHSDFPKFPKDHRDPTAYDRWRQTLFHQLHIPWWQYDGRNICDLTETPSDPIGASISQALLYHLTTSIHASNNPVAVGLLSTLCHDSNPHNGIELLVALDHDARQRTSAALLQDYGDWQALTHKNKEHIVTLRARLKNARDRLARNKYIVSDFQFRVKLYHSVMSGPYGSYLLSLSPLTSTWAGWTFWKLPLMPCILKSMSCSWPSVLMGPAFSPGNHWSLLDVLVMGGTQSHLTQTETRTPQMSIRYTGNMHAYSVAFCE